MVVFRAFNGDGQGAHAVHGVGARIAIGGDSVGIFRVQQLAVFGNEEEQKPVQHAHQLLVVGAPRQRAVAQFLPQRRVVQKPAAQLAQGFFDIPAQRFHGADGGAGSVRRGLLEQAFGRVVAFVEWSKAAGVQHAEKDGECGVVVFLENGFEVELQIRLTHNTHVVAQQAQLQAVGNQGEQMRVAAVEKLLRHGMGEGWLFRRVSRSIRWSTR